MDFVLASDEMVYSSGKESMKFTNSGIRKGTRLSMEKAIEYTEQNNLQETIKNEVIDLWSFIDEEFKVERTRKER